MTDSVAIGVAFRDQAISGGSVDGSPVGATTPSTGAFTTLSASGAITASGGVTGAHNGTVGATTPAAGTFTDLTATGNVALGNAASDTVAFYGATGQAQPASASQTALAASQTTKTTTQLRTELTAVKTLLARIRKDLKAVGLIKGAA